MPEESYINDPCVTTAIRIAAFDLAKALHAYSDIDDFKQEFLMALFLKAHRHNPGRSSIKTFCNRIIHTKKIDIIRRYRADKNMRLRNAIRREVL